MRFVSGMDNKKERNFMLLSAYAFGGGLLMAGMLKERSGWGLPIQFAGLVVIGVLKALA